MDGRKDFFYSVTPEQTAGFEYQTETMLRRPALFRMLIEAADEIVCRCFHEKVCPLKVIFKRGGLMKTKKIPWIAFAGIIGILWMMRGLLTYLFSVIAGGVLLAMLVRPLQAFFAKRLPNGIALITAWISIFSVVVVLGMLLTPFLSGKWRYLCAIWPQWKERILEQITDFRPDIHDVAAQIGQIGNGIFGGILHMADIASRIGLMWMISVFLVLRWEHYILRMELLIPLRWRKRVLQAAKQIAGEITLFLRGQLLVGCCVGVLTAIGLMMVRVRRAVLLGITAGIMNMVPYFGPLIGGIPILLSAWNGGWGRVLASLGVLFAVQQLDGLLISPGIMSSVTGLTPLVVLLSLAAAGWILGPIGLLFAIPGSIFLRGILRMLAQKSRE